MNKSRKADLLYKKARGENMNATSEEMKELRKYKVDVGESPKFATKSNISSYITAVDKGYRLSFYDWCMENRKADKRRKGSSAKDLASADANDALGSVFFGWLTWGAAFYWIFDQAVSVKECAIIGGILSFILYKCARKWAGITLFILPIVLISVFYLYF